MGEKGGEKRKKKNFKSKKKRQGSSLFRRAQSINDEREGDKKCRRKTWTPLKRGKKTTREKTAFWNSRERKAKGNLRFAK